MNTITDKNEVKKWEEVKKIQEDWINRLVDQNSLDYQMIRSAVVIAGTCVGFLSNEVIKDMSFDYVIIDEAAKATTPELLVSIIKAKKIILVGDQNQLPAYADAEVSPTLAKLTKNPDYRLFDILYNSLPDTHKQILTTQYRMIENIGNLISKVFYRGIIDTGCNDDEKRHGLSRYVGKSIVWFDTSANKKKSQKRTKGGSYINEEEKRIILEILDDLKSTGELKGLDIGIITGYSGQKELLRKSIKATGLDKIASKIDINGIESVYVVFIKIPLQVFVSTNGWDIDIVAAKKKYNELLLEYKDEIIRQINNKKVLRAHWKKKTIQESYNGECLKEVERLVETIKAADFKKKKKQKEIDELQMKILSSRRLLDGEVKVLLDYLAENAQQVEMSVDNIDDWAYDKNFVGKLSHYVGKATLKIKYQSSNNIGKAIERIKQGHDVAEYKKHEHGYFICWKFERM